MRKESECHIKEIKDWKSVKGRGRDDGKMGILEGMDTAPETEPLIMLDTVPEPFSEEAEDRKADCSMPSRQDSLPSMKCPRIPTKHGSESWTVGLADCKLWRYVFRGGSRAKPEEIESEMTPSTAL
ncbi:hypothetical protein ILUMI_20849 [Ignelater luminosus]|uniref:Uncharacterized protein n=1 Tax=Ignelater luminosus TaxID=2038154 RepID=A0A8K0CHG9_IGNLU|nr:hypothetical protein ILUMI_20849 [Ignelater luminosus]